MKIVRIISFLMVLTLLLTGCLQVETTLFVKKDGSGTINEKVLFSKTFVNMIKDFAQAFQDSASTEEFSIFEEENIIGDAKDYGDNVVYVSHEKIDNDNWEGYLATYSFDDITKIKISPDPDSKVDIGDEMTDNEKEKEFYFFKFVKGNTPQLIIDRPDIELSSDSREDDDSTQYEENDAEEGEEFVKMMEGMKIDIAVEVDGAIESTNATYVDGSRVTLFHMDFGEMMKNKEAFKEFKKNEPKNIDELKFYLDKLNGIKIEVEKPVTINFE
jgi:hypothetical protein